MKMHPNFFVDSHWWMDEPSFISLVMEFDDILRRNRFFEEISSMYSYISSTQYNSIILSFSPLNFIHAHWLNIHEISFFSWMKWVRNDSSLHGHILPVCSAQPLLRNIRHLYQCKKVGANVTLVHWITICCLPDIW